MNAAIHTSGLAKRFGRTEALRGVDLDVPEGAIYAIVGANGAGKTTLIKLLMNIMRPTAGWAQLLGLDSARLAGADFTQIGYVSENQDLPDAMTVADVLDYLRPFYPRWDRDLEDQLVQQFELPMDRKLRHLSRGMRMKVAFAGSFAYRPKLILLDEPFSGLDPLVRDQLIESLLDRAPETTTLISSHDLAEIESFASHLGYLEDGRLLFSEEMSTLSGRFRDVTVTLPAPRALPAGLPPAWLLPQTADCVVRFVHSNFQPARINGEIASIFPGARDVASEAMPLRSIFLAMARSRGARNNTLQRNAPEGSAA